MSGQMLGDPVPAALTNVELDKKVPMLDGTKDWRTDTEGSEAAHDADGHLITADGIYPTKEEMHGPMRLRRISDDIPWSSFLIALYVDILSQRH